MPRLAPSNAWQDDLDRAVTGVKPDEEGLIVVTGVHTEGASAFVMPVVVYHFPAVAGEPR